MNMTIEEALEKVSKELLAMPKEEFNKLLEKHKNGEWAKLLRGVYEMDGMDND